MKSGHIWRSHAISNDEIIENHASKELKNRDPWISARENSFRLIQDSSFQPWQKWFITCNNFLWRKLCAWKLKTCYNWNLHKFFEVLKSRERFSAIKVCQSCWASLGNVERSLQVTLISQAHKHYYRSSFPWTTKSVDPQTIFFCHLQPKNLAARSNMFYFYSPLSSQRQFYFQLD